MKKEDIENENLAGTEVEPDEKTGQKQNEEIGQKQNEGDIQELRKMAVQSEEVLQAMKRYTDEEDEEGDEITLKSILGGDILGSKFFINQIMFVMTIVALSIAYTANRYDSQQDAILIDSLRQELQSVKYNVMTQSSELLNKTRQSHIEKSLKGTKDSVLTNPVTPPYLIRKDGATEKPLPEVEDDPDAPTGDEEV